MNNLLKIRKGGDVRRFHTMYTLREHLVSSHSWGVATLILEIDPNASIQLIKAALYHDIAEVETGDMPATTKWANPELARLLRDVERKVEAELGLQFDLTDYEVKTLKFADMAELVMSAIDEMRLGNSDMNEVVERGMGYLLGMDATEECRRWLLTDLQLHIMGE